MNVSPYQETNKVKKRFVSRLSPYQTTTYVEYPSLFSISFVGNTIVLGVAVR